MSSSKKSLLDENEKLINLKFTVIVMIPGVPEMSEAEIAEALSRASGKEIDPAVFQMLETETGSCDQHAVLVGDTLTGYSRGRKPLQSTTRGPQKPSGHFLVGVYLTLPHSDSLGFQREVYDSTVPSHEVVKDALTGLVYLMRDSSAGYRITSDMRFGRHFGGR